MKEGITVPGLYVVESDYLKGGQRTVFKYQKVAAVALDTGEVKYVSPHKTDGYDPDRLEQLEVETSSGFLEKVSGFIDRYMRVDARYGNYNCHTFASWMVDGPETTNPLVSRDETSRSRPLDQGEIGFVFARGGDHSTIGLSAERTIQVVTNHGNIGVMNDTQVVEVYGDTPCGVDHATAQRHNFRLPSQK